MGDINQLIFIRERTGQFDGPYLEVGSKDYGTTQDLRSLFPAGDAYIGIDMEEGPGVDIVLDLTADFEHIDKTLGHRRFGTIFCPCLHVMDHS